MAESRAVQEKFAITIRDVRAARKRIASAINRTPLLSNDRLDALLGARVFVKAEPLQRTGSFKFRGAYNRIADIADADRKRGVVAYSSGNHAQGVALAAKLFGMKASIIMPKDTPKLKVENTRGYGAEVILYDRFSESREAIGQEIASRTGAILVPPYDDRHVMAGQGTIGLEVAEDLAARGLHADVLVSCCGGGGLMAGIATAMHTVSPQTKLYAAEPAGYDDTARSLKARRQVPNDPGPMSICDAIVTPTPGQLTFPINRTYLAGGLVVSDAEAAEAVAYAARELKLTIEPGGAVALAAVLSRKVPVKGKIVVVIASGGNIDPAFHAAIMAKGGLPAAH
jgi:threonine dehydratase